MHNERIKEVIRRLEYFLAAAEEATPEADSRYERGWITGQINAYSKALSIIIDEFDLEDEYTERR